MKIASVAIGAAVLMMPAALAHECDKAALRDGAGLLRFFIESDGIIKLAPEPGVADPNAANETMSWSLDQQPTVVSEGSTATLEVKGYVYRSVYTMHFRYSVSGESCALVGLDLTSSGAY